MQVLKLLLTIVLVWLGQSSLTQWLGQAANTIFVVPPLYLWLQGKRKSAISLLLGVSFLVDTSSGATLPLNLATGLVAGGIFFEFIEPRLSTTTSLGKVLAVLLWLATWRLVSLMSRLLMLALKPTANTILEVQPISFLWWFVAGCVCWLLLEALGRVWQRIQR